METIETKYMNFVLIGDTGKTQIWDIHSKSSGAILGRIKWYGPWRQYCLFPSPECVFNISCMNEISGMLEKLNSLQRKRRNEKC